MTLDPTANAWPIPPSQVTLAVEGWNAGDLRSRELFERSLRSLRGQSYPVTGCEVLILLNSGEAEAGVGWLQDLWPGAKAISVPGMTYYRAKNAALRSARREFIALADSDVVYEPNWLASLLAGFTPGVDLVVGNTRFAPGFLSRTLNLCDWPGARPESGYTDWFYGNNLALRRSLFSTIHFREDMGGSGGGSVNVLRRELASQGVRFWFCAEARASHYLAPFLIKRLRVGAYHVRHRQLSPTPPWSWAIRIPLAGPALATGGTLVKAWGRAWMFRRSLPGHGLTLAVYLATLSFVKAVEALGAVAYASAPGWVNRRFGWFDVPQVRGAHGPATDHLDNPAT